LLLVAHSPGRLLPTIRSRCRRMALSPLAPVLVRELLVRYRPELSEREAEAVAALAGGSTGRALDLAAAGGVELYRSVLGLLDRDARIDPLVLHAFADRLARAEAEEGYRATEDLLGRLLARVAVSAVRPIPETASETEESSVLRRLGNGAPAARWAELREEIRQSFARTDDLNLDRKQTILSAFFAIERAAG
jgi:DNA polymerase-3 subunit delta'